MISEYEKVSRALETGDVFTALHLLGYDCLTSTGYVRYGPPKFPAFSQRRRAQPGVPPTRAKIYGLPPFPAFHTRSKEREPSHPCPPAAGIVQNPGVFVGYPRIVPIPLIPAFTGYPIGDPCTPFPNFLLTGNPNFLLPNPSPFKKRSLEEVGPSRDTTTAQEKNSNSQSPAVKVYPYEGGDPSPGSKNLNDDHQKQERVKRQRSHPLKEVFSENLDTATAHFNEATLKEVYSDTVVGLERDQRESSTATSSGSSEEDSSKTSDVSVEKAAAASYRGRGCARPGRDIRSRVENLLGQPPAAGGQEEEERESSTAPPQPGAEDQQLLSVMFSTETFNGSSASSTQELSVTSGIVGQQSLTSIHAVVTASDVVQLTSVQN